MNHNDCPFCDSSESIVENDLAYVRYDKYPVNDGHLLVIPFRHVSDYFDLTDDELLSMQALLEAARTIIDGERDPDGYNIGINVGEAAGQTVMHVHMHLIPRHKGDVDDPSGGVRGVIPDKQHY
jgi:diadenosine tetraphosphate (Ap4A) HIT family hydrolase